MRNTGIQMKMIHKFFLVLFSLLILPNAALTGLFNRGVDVEGRILASAQTANAYYSVLGLSAPMHYSQLKTPIKKNVIAYSKNKELGGWNSACYYHTVDCDKGTIKLIKSEYFDSSDCRGKELKRMIAYDKDLKNYSLPVNVLREIHNVACVMR